MLLLSLIFALCLMIVYLLIKLAGVLKILKAMKSLEGKCDITKKDDFIEKNYWQLLNETADMLQCSVEDIPKKINIILKKTEEYKCELDKHLLETKKQKNILVKLIAEDLKKNPYKFNAFNCFFKKIEFGDIEDTKKICSHLTKEPTSVCLLLNIECTFVIVASSEDITKKGFDSEKIAENITKIAGGTSGGKKSFVMIKIDKMKENIDIFQLAKDIILKELEGMQ